MARPQKEGLDYFPLDVDMDQDDKVLLIEARHGIVGFAILVKLLMKIYKEGYFYEWGERQQLLFSSRVNVDINQIIAVTKSCLEWGLFDKGVYERHGILTSKGIQRRYLEAVKRRKEVNVINEYWLIDDEQKNIVYVDVNGVNVCNNSQATDINVSINPQSKVKESKEDISAQNEQGKPTEKSKPRSPLKSQKQEKMFSVFWKQYPNKKSKGQAEKTWAKITPDDTLFSEIMAGLEQAKRSHDWKKDGGQFIPHPATWLNAKGWEDEHRPFVPSRPIPKIQVVDPI